MFRELLHLNGRKYSKLWTSHLTIIDDSIFNGQISFKSKPKYAIDCEIVESFNTNMLARVTIVDVGGEVVLDEYVKPTAQVTDYRNCVCGMDKSKLLNGLDKKLIKNKVAVIIAGNILIGHSLDLVLKALDLSHPESSQRDLAQYPLLMPGGQPVPLKTLAAKYLDRVIQNRSHDSKENAQACMDLYLEFACMWG